MNFQNIHQLTHHHCLSINAVRLVKNYHFVAVYKHNDGFQQYAYALYDFHLIDDLIDQMEYHHPYAYD